MICIDSPIPSKPPWAGSVIGSILRFKALPSIGSNPIQIASNLDPEIRYFFTDIFIRPLGADRSGDAASVFFKKENGWKIGCYLKDSGILPAMGNFLLFGQKTRWHPENTFWSSP
jgi:hypothetical protein